MARPSWTDIAAIDVDVNSPVDETVMQSLADNCAALRVQPFYFDSGGAKAETLGTMQQQWDFYIDVPDLDDYTGLQRKVQMEFVAYVDAGAGEILLRDVNNVTDGSAVTVTSTSTTNRETVSVNLIAATQGTTARIAVRSRVTTATTITVLASAEWSGFLEY